MSALRKVISHQLSVFSLLLILFLANLFIFTSPVLAADFTQLNSNNFNDSINVQRYYRNQLVALHTILLGTDPTGGPIYGEKITKVTENGQTKIVATPGLTTGSVNNGVIGMLGSTIVALYTPPTSSIEYLANFGENIGLSPKVANAQSVTGSGAEVIKPVLALWQVVRNISYAGFILVFIVAGLMIMFRQKLNPQTVIGIQQALPGLVIGLILVTFSYFIAAFIVDFAFVGMRLVANIFVSSGADNYFYDDNGKGVRNLDYTYNQSSAFDMYGRAATRVQNVGDVIGGTWGLIGPKPEMQPAGGPGKDWVGDILKGVGAGATGGFVIGTLIPGAGNVAAAIIGGIIGGIGALLSYNINQAMVGGVISLLSGLLIPIILMLALMIQFIRLIIALLMSYIQILIMVIAGPLFILISAVPGRGGVLSYWFKGLLANVLIFPAVFAGFLFAGLLLNSTISGATMPLFGGISTEMIRPLLAFGVLLGLPSIPDMVRNALGVKGPQGFTQAALGGFMGGVAAGRTGVSKYTEGAQKRSQAYEGVKMETEAKGLPVATPSVPLGKWGTAKAKVGKWVSGGR